MRGSRPPNSGTILVYNSLIALTKRPPVCNKCLNYLIFVEVSKNFKFEQGSVSGDKDCPGKNFESLKAL